MEFVDVAYAYLLPLLLLSLSFVKGYSFYIIKNLVVVLNVSLLLFVVYDIKSYYELYKLAKAFGIEVNFKLIQEIATSNYFVFIKNLLLIILPLFFVSKKLGSNVLLSSIILFLFWYEVLFSLFTHQTINLPGYNYASYPLQLLKIISLYTTIYSLWWLLKRFGKYNAIIPISK